MRRATRVLAILALATVIAACGESGGGGGGHAGSSPAPGTPTGDELQKNPSDIALDAADSMKELQSYHVTFKGTDSLGQVEIVIDVDSQEQAIGHMTVNGTYSQIVVSGTTLYVQERALAQILINQPQLTPAYDGQWIRIPTSRGVNLDTLRTADLLNQCIKRFGNTNVSARTQTKIDGQPVLPIYTVDASQDRTTFYVALDRSAHLIRWTIQSNPDSSAECTGGVDQNQLNTSETRIAGPVGEFNFSAFNEPVNVLIPSNATQGPTPVPTPTS